MPRRPPTVTPTGARPHPSVSRRDIEVLHHLEAGRSTAAIASAMSISTNTVRTHVHRLQNRLGAPVRDQVVPQAREHGLLAARVGPAGSPVAMPAQGRTEPGPDRTRRT